MDLSLSLNYTLTNSSSNFNVILPFQQIKCIRPKTIAKKQFEVHQSYNVRDEEGDLLTESLSKLSKLLFRQTLEPTNFSGKEDLELLCRDEDDDYKLLLLLLSSNERFCALFAKMIRNTTNWTQEDVETQTISYLL